MCCIMGYAGHDLPAETFTKYLLRTASRGPDDHPRLQDGSSACWASGGWPSWA